MEQLFIDLEKKAVACPQRLVLPESFEPRTLEAADKVIANKAAQVILIGAKEEIVAKAQELGLNNIAQATFVNPADSQAIEKYAVLLQELRKKKGMTIEEARVKATDPLFLGCLMIKNGDADAQVAGAENTTGNVLRAAFQVLKTAPGVSAVSGAFIMLLPEGSPYGENGTMVFADCAVIPDPDANQLAQTAVLTEKTARDIAGIDPKVAMLSFSTKGSASHEKVDKVVEALKIAREMNPDMKIDGELQADAAIVPSVGASKAPGSEIAGKANVLVFPNLEVGNIAYKLVQRLAGATAVGPVLQGLGAPVNDLSRGCSPDDVYKTILLTCNQAISKKNNV